MNKTTKQIYTHAGGTPIPARSMIIESHRTTPTLKLITDDDGNEKVVETTVESCCNDDTDYNNYKISNLLKAGIDPKSTVINIIPDTRLGLDSADYDNLNNAVNDLLNSSNND